MQQNVARYKRLLTADADFLVAEFSIQNFWQNRGESLIESPEELFNIYGYHSLACDFVTAINDMLFKWNTTNFLSILVLTKNIICEYSLKYSVLIFLCFIQHYILYSLFIVLSLIQS